MQRHAALASLSSSSPVAAPACGVSLLRALNFPFPSLAAFNPIREYFALTGQPADRAATRILKFIPFNADACDIVTSNTPDIFEIQLG